MEPIGKSIVFEDFTPVGGRHPQVCIKTGSTKFYLKYPQVCFVQVVVFCFVLFVELSENSHAHFSLIPN